MALAALVPSVVPQGRSLQNPTGTNVQAWGNFQIGGGIADQNATYLDGVPLNNNYNNNNSLVRPRIRSRSSRFRRTICQRSSDASQAV